MKNYKITVNGVSYDVQVEEAGSVAPVNTAPVAAAPAPSPAQNKPVTESAPSSPAPTGSGSAKVTSPMPGNILDIKVNVGDKVEANQCVIILEAMKMENEIVSPYAGTVASVNVSKGQTVSSDDVLITIAE